MYVAIHLLVGQEPRSLPLFVRGKVNKLKIVIEKKRMGIMTYKQHLFFNVISIQI